MTRKLLKTRHYKAGYDVRYEEISGDEAGGGKSFVIRSAYTPDGHYIGNPFMARQLIVKRGIKPVGVGKPGDVCSIGFCERNQKWYGWSHRAIVGFGIGDKLFEQDFHVPDETTPFVEHGTVTIEYLEQAEQAAANFADYVS